MTAFADLVLAVERATGRPGRRAGRNTRLLCPVHDDHTPSLDIAEGDNGSPLVVCRSCAAGLPEVCEALHLEIGAFLQPREDLDDRSIVATYDYPDELGKMLFQVVRRADKQFPQRRPDGAGGWVWNLNGTRRVLYRLPLVLAAAKHGYPVWIAEGEKDCDALEDAGIVATCNPGGAGKWRPEYAEALRGASEVVVVADRDEAGLDHARTVAASAQRVVGKVRIVQAAQGKDAADHLRAGLTVHDFEPVAYPPEEEVSSASETSSPFEITALALDEFADVDEPGADALVGEGDDALIPEDGDVMFYGDGGAGKTTLCIDLACHLAAGDDWLGVPITRVARVLLVENEGPRPLFRKKLRRKRDGWTGSPLEDRLQVVVAPWARLSFADEACREALADLIRELAIDVVIVGPVTRSGMNEAGTLQEVRDFMVMVAAVRRLAGRHVTFILVHHENKGGKVSGAWEGAGDTLFHVQGQGHGRTRLYVQKARWSSSHHATTVYLAWTDGDGFAIVDDPERDENTIADEILAFVLANGGTSWTKVEESPAVHGQGQRLRAIRDRLIAGGRLVNAGTEPRYKLWHADDPATPTTLTSSRPGGDGIGTGNPSGSGDTGDDPNPSPVPYVVGTGTGTGRESPADNPLLGAA